MAPPKFDKTHWSSLWSVSPNMSLYVALTGNHPGHSRPQKLGELVGVRFTKSQQNAEGKTPPSFVLSVVPLPSRDTASRDVDHPTVPEQVCYIVKEDLYHHFTNTGWNTHPALLAAASKARSSNNQGKWFKEFVKNNLQSVYNAELSFTSSPSGEAQTGTPGSVDVGASVPSTPHNSDRRPPVTPLIPAAFPPPRPTATPPPAAQGATGGGLPPRRLHAGVFVRMCCARTIIAYDLVYRNPKKHPQKLKHTPIFI